MLDLLTFIKRRVPALPQPKPPRRKKKDRHTWEYAKRRPYSFLLSKDTVAELDTIAKQLGISRSMLVDQILKTFVEQWKNYGKTNPSNHLTISS
jgi:hypothetical protein